MKAENVKSCSSEKYDRENTTDADFLHFVFFDDVKMYHADACDTPLINFQNQGRLDKQALFKIQYAVSNQYFRVNQGWTRGEGVSLGARAPPSS